MAFRLIFLFSNHLVSRRFNILGPRLVDNASEDEWILDETLQMWSNFILHLDYLARGVILKVLEALSFKHKMYLDARLQEIKLL